MALMGFGDFDDMFGNVDRMMNSMMRNMFNMSDPFSMNMMGMQPFPSPDMRLQQRAHQSPYLSYMTQPTSYSYSTSSSLIQMGSSVEGRPQYYESSHSTHNAPGGVREVRSSVRDSRTGLQQMSIGHHIRDRGHVMQRSNNQYTGEREENDEYINLDEEEAPAFTEEWRRRITAHPHRYHNGYNTSRQLPASQEQTHRQLALPAPPTVQASSSRAPQEQVRSKISHKSEKKSKKCKKPYNK